MYQFKVIKLEEGGYRFELGAIKIYTEGFSIKDGKHFFTNPNKVIGYFNVDGNLYGVSNDPLHADSVEAFYDSMSTQYLIFSHTNKNNNLGNFRQTA